MWRESSKNKNKPLNYLHCIFLQNWRSLDFLICIVIQKGRWRSPLSIFSFT